MKRKMAVFAMFFAFMLCVLGVCVGAEESIYAKNIREINNGVYTLSGVMDGYAEADGSEEKAVAIRTNAVILNYVNTINALRADGRVSSEDLSAEVMLLSAKGVVAGECAWIFESYAEELSADARARIFIMYENTLEEIDLCVSIESLNESADAYVAGVILSIYEEKIAALCSADDSVAVLSIADAAISEMRGLMSTDRADYERIFVRARGDIQIQRREELAIASFAAAYDKINGQGSFEREAERDENILYFLYLASQADTVESFNLAIESSLVSAVTARIGDVFGTYKAEILQDMTRSLAELGSEADERGDILDASALFNGLPEKIFVAEKKDELLLYVNESFAEEHPSLVTDLIEEYCGAGGIFETCADERLAEFSLRQAKLRVDLCAECEHYMRLSESFFDEPYAEIARRFEELYFSVDAEMARALTLEATRDALRLGRARAETLCFEFEAEAYLLRFADMAEKPLSEITREDAASLRAAISEYDALGATARDLAFDEAASLCEKYKAAIADYLYYIAVGDGDVQITLEYSALLDNTEFSGDGARFLEYCEVIRKKAESEMRVCAIYKEIASREEYFSFADGYKNALRECRDIYILRIKDVPIDRVSADAELAAVIRSAELEMLRVYTEAVIASFATVDDSEAVSAIIASAIADLRFADSIEELEVAAERTELDVYRQRAKEALSTLKIRTDGSLELIKYLSVESIGEYRAALSALEERAYCALDESTELALAVDAFEEFRAQILALYESATAANLVAAKLWARAQIEKESDGLLSEIENMKYISDTERARLVAAAQSESERAIQSAELSAYARDVESAVADASLALGAILSDAAECELEAAKAACLSTADLRAQETVDALDLLTYIPTARAESIKSELSSNLGALAQRIEASASVSEVEVVLDEFIVSLSEAEQAAIAENLRLAIETLGGELDVIRAAFSVQAAEARYIDSASLAEHTARADELCGTALSRLASAEDVSVAESIWQSAADALGELSKSLERDELAAARTHAQSSLRDSADASVARIFALEYLGEPRKAQLSLDMDSLILEFSLLLHSDATPAVVESRLLEYNQKIKTLEASAEAENLAEARARHTAALDSAFAAYSSADYTSQRYAQIKDAYEAARLSISTASDVASIEDLFSSAQRSMAEVVSIFEDRKSELARSVQDAYAELLKMSSQYSAESILSLGEIRARALEALESAESAIGLSALDEIASGAISAMRELKLEWISSGKMNADSSGFAEYPAGYDYSVGGIWGVVESSYGLPSELRLSIMLTDSNKFYKKALREAIAGARIAYVGDVPMSDAEIRERLEDFEIKGVFSIKLHSGAAVYDEFSGEYTVRILLPASMRQERTLRVLYISPDGDAEYYDATCEGGMLVFRTTHFSDFLVLGERRVDLLPIIALLSFLGVLEGLVLIATRAWMKREAIRTFALSPMPFAALSVIVPRGGALMIAVLLAVDITLGVLIFIDLRALRKARQDATAARVYALPLDFEDSGEERASLDAEERVAMLPAYLDRVSAEDADSLISDRKASALIIRSAVAPKVCRGCKKTFVNVDTLSESFARGETVSINSLREKGIIPMSACYVKILARGVIDKPLTVRAQGFSANAVKMITLTGGSAILEGSDRE